MEWISVKDRLPTGADSVLGLKTRYVINSDNGKRGTFLDYQIVRYDPELWHGWRHGELCELPMDYWMPLPKPPEDIE